MFTGANGCDSSMTLNLTIVTMAQLDQLTLQHVMILHGMELFMILQDRILICIPM